MPRLFGIKRCALLSRLYAAAIPSRPHRRAPPRISAARSPPRPSRNGALVTGKNSSSNCGRENHPRERRLREAESSESNSRHPRPRQPYGSAQSLSQRQETMPIRCCSGPGERLAQEVLLATGFAPKRVGELYAAI